jgi:ferredoxin--NADP+ reductase
VGSGPAGFYVAEHLLKRDGLVAEIDMYERLPTPFGLVRFGVAPDHQKIKNVCRTFERVAGMGGYRFLGNVEIGRHISLKDLRQHYHQICFATGALSDRRMNIPGEDLDRSHPATEFVAWYNGHPDYRELEFDLSAERVAVVGVGNVAIDVARILCRTHNELMNTDVADYALAALRQSRVKEIIILGRRGPAQAAFTNAEVKELGELAGADVTVPPEDMELDPLSQAEVDASDDTALRRRLEILRRYAGHAGTGKPRLLTLRFLVSPVELIGDVAGGVAGIRLVKNSLYRSEDGTLRPKPTDQTEEMPLGLVFRSVGYRGEAIPDLPFDDRRGVVPNLRGRVIEPDTEVTIVGTYVSGWIKRGPYGVIGTNKPDAAETVASMLEDLSAGEVLDPELPESTTVEALVGERKPDWVSYEDWQRLDELEVKRGEDVGRPRVKFTKIHEMLKSLGRG